jgi:hypothetical protein
VAGGAAALGLCVTPAVACCGARHDLGHHCTLPENPAKPSKQELPARLRRNCFPNFNGFVVREDVNLVVAQLCLPILFARANRRLNPKEKQLSLHSTGANIGADQSLGPIVNARASVYDSCLTVTFEFK